MRAYKIILLIVIFSFFGCEKPENIEGYIFKTWELDWKQCGVYQNKYDIKINFTQTDSIYYGWVLEQGKDTVMFNVEVLNDNQVVLFESTDSIWDGVLNIKDFNTGLLLFEREIKQCNNELFRFE